MSISADFHIQRDRSFITLASLELHRVTFIEVLDLGSRGETAPMEEHFVAPVIGSNETVPLLADYFFDRTCHLAPPVPSVASRRHRIQTRISPSVEMTMSCRGASGA